MHNKKHSFVQGAMILSAATMVVKIMGMLYKIPLGNILGAVGMSYFMTAYSIFNPVYALSVSGFPVAMSKMVAESAAKRRYRETRKIFRCSFALFVATGIAGFAVMFFGAELAASLVHNPDAAPAIRAMAPAIFFCCIISAYRGYYQGLGNMAPTAVSQILESLFKLICGVVFSILLLNRAARGFELGGAVFGGTVLSRAQAELMALPWAAAGAILGVTASSVAGAVYLACRHGFGGDGVTREAAASPNPPSSRTIIKRLALLSLPVCLGSVLTQVTALIDVVTIMNRIGVAVDRGGDVITAMYGGLIPPDITLEGIPGFLYGAYGYCSSLFNLVPALTIPLGISVLPLISSHWALGGRTQAANHTQSVIKLSSLIAIPAGLGLSALAHPILELLYPARAAEAMIAAPILEGLGIAAVFVGIIAPVNSAFQAVGRADIPVKLMAAGAAIKLVTNYFLLAIPRLNINAAPCGTVLCYLFIFTASLIELQNVLGARINMIPVFFKPLICGIICAIAAHTSHEMLSGLIPSRFSCLISIAIAGSIYLIFVLFLRIITKNEILLLPGGKNVAKILEKLFLLG